MRRPSLAAHFRRWSDSLVRWVFDIVRGIEDEARRQQAAEYTLKVALEGKADGVVALGLGGTEVGYPPEQFARWFEQALSGGLHSTPHAGETVGPTSVWGALHTLGAERIGHGVRSIEDPVLVTYLATRQIPLELCPTSNCCLGVYPDMAVHPLRRLHAAGVPLTINSDDPPLFNTMLTQEVALLAEEFAFDLPTINEILLNGVRYSFLPPEQKHTLETEFQAEMGQLQREIELT